MSGGSFTAAHGLSSYGAWASVVAELFCSMWDLSFPTRDGTRLPCFARQVLNHWTTREVLKMNSSKRNENSPVILIFI